MLVVFRFHAANYENGRSRVAKEKLRYFGKFITSEEYHKKVLTDKQIVS